MDFLSDHNVVVSVSVATACIIIQLLLESISFLHRKHTGYSNMSGIPWSTSFFILWLTACYAVLGWGFDLSLREAHNIANDVRKTWVALAVINLWAAHVSAVVYSRSTCNDSEGIAWKNSAIGVILTLLYTSGVSITAFASTVDRPDTTAAVAYVALALIIIGFLLFYTTSCGDRSGGTLGPIGVLLIVCGMLSFVLGWVLLALAILTKAETSV
jgi:hypothetical protein